MIEGFGTVYKGSELIEIDQLRFFQVKLNHFI